MKTNKKGFTLIELLAVIVILGVLLVIAVPKVTKYITNSRKESYVGEVDTFIGTVRDDITSEFYPAPIKNNDVVIITFDTANLDKAQNKSPYGGKYIYSKSYVAVVNVGQGADPEYKYYVSAQDTKGYAIPLTSEENLTKDKVIANAKNKMEVTIQSICGTKEGYNREYTEISGLNDIQPVDENGNKISWNATIYSSEACSGE